MSKKVSVKAHTRKAAPKPARAANGKFTRKTKKSKTSSAQRPLF